MQNFPDYLHLERIRQSLWQNREYGRASVLVGAGLSLNAVPLSPSLPSFPTWSRLSESLVDCLHPEKNSERDRILEDARSTSGSLRIAEQFEAAFGRDALESFLLQEIPDTSYRPSVLHSLLLRLPWSDVLTTNYDTLLERAAAEVTERKYSVIRNPADIPNAARPRITKLHGSFPSTRPFIFTEEDFRSYTRKFAPFVNLTQQIAMETVMCLIGFSGDDPNFLYWTGWVRDHLGKSAPQIYLCGLLNLNNARRNLLHDRNVVPIDLSPVFPTDKWPNAAQRYYAAIEWFLLNLEQGQPPSALLWPTVPFPTRTPATTSNLPEVIPNRHVVTLEEEPAIDPNDKSSISSKISRATSVWSHNRQLYPGWLIAPTSNRDRLWRHTESWIQIFFDKEFAQLEPAPRLEFLYELNWRLQMCLVPLSNIIAEEIERLLIATNPFPEIGLPIGPEANRVVGKNARGAWVDLAVSVFRLAREDQKYAAYDTWLKRLEALDHLRPDLTDRRIYERILFALGQAKTDDAETLNKEWQPRNQDPYWSVRKAGILAELGHLNEAIQLTTSSLLDIRQRSTTAVDDIFLLSREGWALKQLQFLTHARDWMQFRPTRSNVFEGRWEQLARLKCDPNPDWEIAESRLDSDIPKAALPVSEQVDITGVIQKTIHFGNGFGLQLIPAHQAIRMVEEAGLPTSCNHVTIGGSIIQRACKWLATTSPESAAPNAVRTRMSDKKNRYFTSTRLALLSDEQASEYLVRAGEALTYFLNRLKRIAGGDVAAQDTYSAQAVSSFKMNTRLLYRATDTQIDSHVSKVIELYTHTEVAERHEIASAFIEYGKTVLQYASGDAVDKNLLSLLELPISKHNRFAEHAPFWWEPFNFINQSVQGASRAAEPSRWEAVISKLLSAASNANLETRSASISRLWRLKQNGLLSDNEVRHLTTAIWSNVDQNSKLPRDTGLFSSILLELTDGAARSARRLLKKYYLSLRLKPIVTKVNQADGTIHATMAIAANRSIDLEDLRHVSQKAEWGEERNSVLIDWTPSEAKKLLAIVEQWWETEGSWLANDNRFQDKVFGSDQFSERLELAMMMVGYVVVPRIANDKNAISRVQKLVDDIRKTDTTIGVLPLFLGVCPSLAEHIAATIRAGLASSERELARSATDSLSYWFHRSEMQNAVKAPVDLVLAMADTVYLRRYPAVIHSLSQFAQLIERGRTDLDSVVIDRLLIGLSLLADETAYRNDVPDIGLGDDAMVIVRKSAARLAIALEKRRLTSSPVLEKWKKLVQSDPLVLVRRVAQ